MRWESVSFKGLVVSSGGGLRASLSPISAQHYPILCKISESQTPTTVLSLPSTFILSYTRSGNMSGAYRRAMGSKRNNVPAVVGLVLLVGGFGSIPLLVRKSNENHNLLTSEKPLTGSQIQRGMYLNTGSQDAGPDPVSPGTHWPPARSRSRMALLFTGLGHGTPSVQGQLPAKL